jgi:hypothetical protein
VTSWAPPALVLGPVFVLLLAQVLHALSPGGRRRYPAVLALTVAGVLLGQLWDVLGLPAARVGQLDLLPAVLFATALQPLGGRLSLRLP